MDRLHAALPTLVGARSAMVMSTTAVAAVLVALSRRNPQLLLTLLRSGAKRPLTSASVPAALAVLLAAQRLYVRNQASPEELLAHQAALAESVENEAEEARLLATTDAIERYPVLSRMFVPRLLSSPLDSVKEFAYAQAAAATRGWGQVQTFWNVRTSRLGGVVQAGIEDTLTRSTDALAARIVAAVKDPDMPGPVTDLIDGAFAEIMPTVKQRVLRKADEYLFTPVRQRLRRRRPKPIHLSEQEVSQRLSTMPWYRRARARVLYIMDPHDQTIWRCMRRKSWWAIQFVGVIPWVGPLWWLLIFIMKDKTDEFQLVDLIVSNEASKFVSWGFFQLVLGTTRYYLCASAQLMDCSSIGPRLGVFDFLFFVMQVSLVWAAFWMLPYSHRRTRRHAPSQPTLVGLAPATPPPNFVDSPLQGGVGGVETTGAGHGAVTPGRNLRARTVSTSSAASHASATPDVGTPQLEAHATGATGAAAHAAATAVHLGQEARAILARTGERARVAIERYFNPKQGGVVRRMYAYLTVIIVMTVALGGVAWLLCPTQWQLLATLYWIRVIFGLLSAPFVVFKIPLVSKLLVPARKTSYNQVGDTVLYQPVVRALPPKLSKKIPTRSNVATPAEAAAPTATTPTAHTPQPAAATSTPGTQSPASAVPPATAGGSGNRSDAGGLRRSSWSRGWLRRERRSRGGLRRERRSGVMVTSIDTPTTGESDPSASTPRRGSGVPSPASRA